MFGQFNLEILQLQFILHTKWVYSSEVSIQIYNNLKFSGIKETKLCQHDIHRNCSEYAHKLSAKLPQMKFTCDSTSIDEEVNCNCFSPCNEVTYDADIIISNYQKDEIEKTKTEKYEKVWSLK
jgi:hypothetical protein